MLQGKKDANVLPNGEKIVHLKVGGRTSAIVPSRQKKTGAVAGDVASEDGEEKVASKGRKRKVKAEEDEEASEEEVVKPAAKRGARGKNGAVNGVKAEVAEETQADGGAEEEKEEEVKPAKKAKANRKKATPKKAEKPVTPGERRSTRNRV